MVDYEALERLARLKDSGALTEEEFNSQKRKLLSVRSDAEDEDARSERRRVAPGMVLLAGISLIAVVAFASWSAFVPEDTPQEAATSTSSTQNSLEEVEPLNLSMAPADLPQSGSPEAAQSSSDDQTFPLSDSSFDVAITRREGLNSASATMSGQATRGSVLSYCELNRGGEQRTTGECVDRTLLEERERTHTVRANCKDQTVSSWDGSKYRKNDSPTDPSQTWRSVSDGSEVGGMHAITIGIYFEMLCPRFASIES